jgi:hypothetical protein
MDIETVMLFRSALYSVAGMVDTFFGRATGRALQEMECGPTLDGTEDRPRSASHPNGRPGLRWVSEEERRAFIEHQLRTIPGATLLDGTTGRPLNFPVYPGASRRTG